MSIANRKLKAGTKLIATYKGKVHTAEVLKTDDGMRYRLKNGREFQSLSSAGSAIMGGTACNGRRFWSLASEGAGKRTPAKRQRQKAGDTKAT